MKKTIGIIGGGQLGLMISQEAHRLNFLTNVLDPSKDAPAFSDANSAIIARYDDEEALRQLGDASDVLSYEFENVPGETLKRLEENYNIPQGIQTLLDSQDRLREKEKAREYGLTTVRYVNIDKGNREILKDAVDKLGYPCVLKTRRLGYDGHGQKVLRSDNDLEEAEELLSVPCLLEEFIDFDYECSIIMVRSDNQIIHFPIGQNIHKQGILDLTIVPAPLMTRELEQQIVDDCRRFMEKAGYKGILAIELFIKEGRYYFNEMAPRPHNSGHYTIEGCTTNQYRELVNFLTGKRLQQPELKAPTIMKNILGEDMPNVCKLEGIDNCYIHLYGKTVCRPKRKMGHITFLGLDSEGYNANYKSFFE